MSLVYVPYERCGSGTSKLITAVFFKRLPVHFADHELTGTKKDASLSSYQTGILDMYEGLVATGVRVHAHLLTLKSHARANN